MRMPTRLVLLCLCKAIILLPPMRTRSLDISLCWIHSIRSYRYRIKRFVIAGGPDLPPLCSRRGLDPKSASSVDDTVHSFDQESAQQLRPKLCHVSSPLRPDLCLLLVSIYPLSSQCQDPKSASIVDDTDDSFDQEPVQQLRPKLYRVSSPLRSALCFLLVSI
jgi:hypothetical protein